MEYSHQAVLLKEALNGLAIKPDGCYVDATFGRGGHSRAILNELSSQGKLLVIDQDPEAIAEAEELSRKDKRLLSNHGTFATLSDSVHLSLGEQVDGILFDLGVSSPQLDNAGRGFSFLRDGPLDMRMDTTKGVSAAEWIATVEEDTLVKILKEYGEERFAKRIARGIVEARDVEEIKTTKQLAEIISAAVPVKEKFKHPATRSFQAIRIFINKELEALKEALEQCLDVLVVGGRLAVISFHSLEDRIVKRFMRSQAKGKEFPKGIAVQERELGQRLRVIGKKIKASQEELAGNPRARSAVLRIAEKIA